MITRLATFRCARRSILPVFFAILSSVSTEARADNSAAAEALFLNGRKLLQEQKFAEACPKLAESHRLDPATGTLLALALCYEGQGKTASAWAAYREVEVRARAEKSNERANAAKERVGALEPKLAKVVVEFAPGVEKPVGTQVTRDGTVLGEGSLGTPIPVDAGEHNIVVEAPGKVPFTDSALVSDGETKRFVIAALASAKDVPPKDQSTFFTPMRIAGLATGAFGVVSFGIAGALAGVATSKKAESDKDCQGDICGPVGLPIRKEARSFGDGATVTLVAGGVLAAAGLTLVLVGASNSPSKAAAKLTPSVSPTTAGLTFDGTF